MNADEIRAYRNAKPFRPFYIEMSDGRSVFVALPIRMGISPQGGTIGVFEGDPLRILKGAEIASIRQSENSGDVHKSQP